MLVTGAARGIGRAICLAFAQEGWRIGVHYRSSREQAEETAREIHQAGGTALCCPADLRSVEQVDALVRTMMAAWGRIDVLICNAAVASARLLLRLSSDEWNAVVETNLRGAFFCLRAAGAHMVAARRGSILILGSFAALQGHAGQAAYAASKAGLIALARTAAQEWGSSNVRVNIVLPGRHPTALTERHPTRDVTDHLLGRTPSLQHTARLTVALALLPDASGQVWNLDSRYLPEC